MKYFVFDFLSFNYIECSEDYFNQFLTSLKARFDVIHISNDVCSVFLARGKISKDGMYKEYCYIQKF